MTKGYSPLDELAATRGAEISEAVIKSIPFKEFPQLGEATLSAVIGNIYMYAKGYRWKIRELIDTIDEMENPK